MSASLDNRSSRWKAVSLGLAVLLAGLIIWNGAARKSADANKPLPQSSSAGEQQTSPSTLKISSFNIHGGKGRDGVRDLKRIADLIRDCDVVGLYEVRGSSQQNQAAELASLCETQWLFAATEQQWWSDHFGNGLLHRMPLCSVLRIPLVNTRGKAFRNAILSTVKVDNTDVRVLAVHIDREQDRRHQLQSMVDLFLGLQPPCILMGDLNSRIDDPILSGLREHKDVSSPLHTSTTEEPPSQSIDWIFTRGLKTISASFVENTASDHPCIKAELEPMTSDSSP